MKKQFLVVCFLYLALWFGSDTYGQLIEQKVYKIENANTQFKTKFQIDGFVLDKTTGYLWGINSRTEPTSTLNSLNKIGIGVVQMPDTAKIIYSEGGNNSMSQALKLDTIVNNTVFYIYNKDSNKAILTLNATNNGDLIIYDKNGNPTLSNDGNGRFDIYNINGIPSLEVTADGSIEIINPTTSKTSFNITSSGDLIVKNPLTGDTTISMSNYSYFKIPGMMFGNSRFTFYYDSISHNVTVGENPLNYIDTTIINIDTLGIDSATIANKNTLIIQGDNTAINITSNPQIADGFIGQTLQLFGNSDVNTVTLENGNGLHLTLSAILAAGDVITLRYLKLGGIEDWYEVSRSIQGN